MLYAKNQAASNPANTVLDAKRLMLRRFSDPSVQIDKSLWPFSIVCGPSDKLLINVMFKGEEKMLTAEEISSMVFLTMKKVAQQYLGYPVNKDVIIFPSYFNNSQRRATKDAGKMAGFDVLELLNKSTAATIAYGLDGKISSSDNGENVLIFDLGREALDVTVLTINKNKIEVKAMGIDTCLGAEDFNLRMVKHFVAEFNGYPKWTYPQMQQLSGGFSVHAIGPRECCLPLLRPLLKSLVSIRLKILFRISTE
jgi:heat shock protein 1/8